MCHGGRCPSSCCGSLASGYETVLRDGTQRAPRGQPETVVRDGGQRAARDGIMPHAASHCAVLAAARRGEPEWGALLPAGASVAPAERGQPGSQRLGLCLHGSGRVVRWRAEPDGVDLHWLRSGARRRCALHALVTAQCALGSRPEPLGPSSLAAGDDRGTRGTHPRRRRRRSDTKR
jgi:hypothetical protein